MDEGEVPETVEIPEGYGAKVFSGKMPESATYEGFTPSAFYSLVRADLDAPESGTYYATVSSIEESGNYGVILGYREKFSLMEWLFIPLNQIRIYRWEGQSLPFIFFPLGITLAAGILAISLKKEAAARFNPAHCRSFCRPFLSGYRLIIYTPDDGFTEQEFIFSRSNHYNFSGSC
ncbi:hypothetical protein [Methanosarcina horonobensis]|uniref:hypothetical protein n=1 Tax=Methanosarcina horonobensis TaxID=418008 RepID=UPI000A86EB9C|nr:hypothetical protein [Methanosarcina horonobensis]